MEISAYSASEAARELRVNDRRIRQLVAAGLLDAKKVGGRLLVDPSSVRRLKNASREPGRALAPRNAWALLNIASGKPAAALDPKSLWRVHRYLEHSDDIRRVAHRLSRRAVPHFLRGHVRDVEAIGSDDRLLLSGASASDHHRFDLVARGVVEAYVDPEIYSEIRRRYFLEDDESSRTSSCAWCRRISGMKSQASGTPRRPPPPLTSTSPATNAVDARDANISQTWAAPMTVVELPRLGVTGGRPDQPGREC